ncbi:MAG: hypothetical protein WB500_07190 [Rhodoplanes sp.]
MTTATQIRKMAAIGVLCLLGFAEFATAAPLARVWDFPTTSALPQSLVADRNGKSYLYLAQKDGGLVVLDLAQGAGGPKAVAQLPIRAFGGLHAMNLVQDGDRLFVALGDLFAATGSKAGLAIIDVSQPAQPRVMSVWTSATTLKGSAVVLVSGRYAYLGAMRAGVFIFDVSNPRAIVPVASILPDVNFPRPNPNRVQHPNARGLAIKGDLLFVAYDSGGIRVIDVADKAKPREIARYINAAIRNKQQAYNNIVINGRLAYAAVDYCGLEILDIGNPQAIRQTGWWNPWHCETMSNNWFNSPGHTNQLVLDANRQLVFLSAGDSELLAVDVKNPARPELASHFGAPKDGRGTWGLAVTDRNVFLTYIKALIPFRGGWAGVTALSR